jgi:hypothetical protein
MGFEARKEKTHKFPCPQPLCVAESFDIPRDALAKKAKHLGQSNELKFRQHSTAALLGGPETRPSFLAFHRSGKQPSPIMLQRP